MRLRITCALLILSLCSLAVPDQPGRGKEVVDAALQALGGARYLAVRTRLVSGRVYSFFHDELSGFDRARIYTHYLSAPNDEHGLSVEERQLLGKKQDYSFLYKSDRAWELTFRGARPVEDVVWQRWVRTNFNDALYILHARHDEPGLTYEYVGNEVFVSHHVDVVDIVDSRDRVVRVLFDASTHLPVHQSFEWLDDQTHERNDEVTDFDKYRDVGGGVQWPFTIERARNGYKVFQVFAESGQVNVEPPAGTFELPANSKVLR